MTRHDDHLGADAQIVFQQLSRFLEESRNGSGAVIRQRPIDTLIEELNLSHLLQEGNLGGSSLRDFVDQYLAECTRLHHPGFLAQQVAASQPMGALGSLIDGVTNNAMAIYEMGPSASTVEYFMIDWLLQRIGWRTVSADRQLDTNSDHAGGTLTHGGSLGNLTALLAARSARFPDAWSEGAPSNVVVLVPEQSHYSLKRTVGILGLGENHCVAIAADADGKVDPSGLQAQIMDYQSRGITILAVVANGCGTAVGLYDPIDAIADICEQHGIWLHVDAAHGGTAILSDRYRYLLKGLERADSVVWDAHKMMLTPTVCAAVLVRDHRHLDGAFHTEASYLIHEKEQPGFDFLLRNVECTKAGLGLRFFMSVAAVGEKGLVSYYEQVVELCKQTAEWIQAQEDLRLAVMPETNILCFQVLSADGVAQESRQFAIRTQLLKEGNFYISTTAYQGQRWLRLVFMNSNTQWQHIEQLMADIRRLNRQL